MAGRVATPPPTSLVSFPSQAPPGREPIAPLLGWHDYIAVTRLVCRGKSPGTSLLSSRCSVQRARQGLTAVPHAARSHYPRRAADPAGIARPPADHERPRRSGHPVRWAKTSSCRLFMASSPLLIDNRCAKSAGSHDDTGVRTPGCEHPHREQEDMALMSGPLVPVGTARGAVHRVQGSVVDCRPCASRWLSLTDS